MTICILAPLGDKYDELYHQAKRKLEEQHCEVVDCYISSDIANDKMFTDYPKTRVAMASVVYALRTCAACDRVYMVKGWEDSNFCRSIYYILMEYGVPMIME